MPIAELLLILVLLTLVVLSGFFSGSETALFSLSNAQRQRLAKSKTVTEGIVHQLLTETRSLLITILLGNMIVNVLFFALGTILLIRLEKSYDLNPLLLAALSLAPLLLIILFGEVLPKLVAARHALAWSKLIALPMYLAHRVTTPLRVFLNAGLITPLARLIAPAAAPQGISAEELEILLKQSQRHGVIDHHEEELLQQVLSLSDLKVRDVMTPRVDIRAFYLESPAEDLIQLFHETRLSHLPIVDKSLDEIRGVVHARQALLRHPETREEIEKLTREVTFVPEQQRVDQLLIHFRRRGVKLAIVVDEYGGTAGLITIEDVVEQMVGEIVGPYEPGIAPSLEQIEPGVWRVSADLILQELAERFGRELEKVPGAQHISTIGGLVMAKLGRLPAVEDVTSIGNLEFKVDAMEGRRITQLVIRLLSTDGAQSQGTDDEKDTGVSP